MEFVLTLPARKRIPYLMSTAFKFTESERAYYGKSTINTFFVDDIEDGDLLSRSSNPELAKRRRMWLRRVSMKGLLTKASMDEWEWWKSKGFGKRGSGTTPSTQTLIQLRRWAGKQLEPYKKKLLFALYGFPDNISAAINSSLGDWGHGKKINGKRVKYVKSLLEVILPMTLERYPETDSEWRRFKLKRTNDGEDLTPANTLDDMIRYPYTAPPLSASSPTKRLYLANLKGGKDLKDRLHVPSLSIDLSGKWTSASAPAEWSFIGDTGFQYRAHKVDAGTVLSIQHKRLKQSWDDQSGFSGEQMQSMFEWLLNQINRAREQTIIVNCNAGQNRSPTFVMWLLTKGFGDSPAMSAKEAYDKVVRAFDCENNTLIPENWTTTEGNGPPMLKENGMFQKFLFPKAKRGDPTLKKIRNNKNTMPNTNPYWVQVVPDCS